jgi:hypothetical protein
VVDIDGYLTDAVSSRPSEARLVFTGQVVGIYSWDSILWDDSFHYHSARQTAERFLAQDALTPIGGAYHTFIGCDFWWVARGPALGVPADESLGRVLWSC